jgi:type VI secretion system protein ImpL
VAADAASVKMNATQIRRRIDDLIASWGIEFPVILVFTRMDEVPGFNDFFASFSGKNDQVFGAAIGEEAQKMLPRQAFKREFDLLCASMSERRLESLSVSSDAGRKRLICRFAIHFEGMQEKLSDFITELFKPSSYEGKPLFHGFYFTSCQKARNLENETVSPVTSQINISNTIANHPFNPRRIAAMREGPSENAVKTAQLKSYFTTALFSSLISGNAGLTVKHTQKRSRQEMIRHYIFIALIAAVSIGFCWYLFAGMGANRKLFDSYAEKLSGNTSVRSYADAFKKFGDIGRVTIDLQRSEDRGPSVSLGGPVGIYKGRKVLSGIKPEFILLSQKLILKPALKYIEYSINGLCDQPGELTGEQHLALYRSLKAYLTVSEAVAGRGELIDTTFMREALVEAVTQSLMRAEGQSRLPPEIETIVNENLGLLLSYLKRGQFPLIQENQSTVAYARRRLQRLPDATTLYQSVAARVSEDVPRISLSDILGSTEGSILKSELTVSAIYTKEGWDRYVRDAIADASKDPFKLDWVMGSSGDKAPSSLPDPSKLRDAMKEAYCTDYANKWLEFIGAVSMEEFGDLDRSGRIIKKLISSQSEFDLLLNAVADYTDLELASEASENSDKAIAMASKFKGTKALAKKAGKLQSAAENAADDFDFVKKTGGDYLRRTFDPFRSFVKSSQGALGGYEGYKDHAQTLVEKTGDIAERGDAHAVVVFNGTETDPLLASWKYTQNCLAGFPEDLSAPLGNLLLMPLRHTGTAASAVLTRKLNERWQDEVVKPFTSRFASGFPLKGSSAEEASFNDVMEFFRPNTGTLWGFYNRVLAPFVIKNGNDWTAINVGSLELNFNPDILPCLKNAERIREIFFKTDGTLRTMNITITPLTQNRYRSSLDVNGQTADLKPGGQSVQIRWPIDAPSQGAVLKAYVSDDFTQDITCRGRWGLMRLLQKAKINILNKSTFDATWEMNVQNMYTAYLTFRIQVSGNDNPFGEPVFSQFNCPTSLTIPKKEAEAAPQAGE